jgi:hypothetical protein
MTSNLHGFYFGLEKNDYGEVTSTIDKESQVQIKLLSHMYNKKTIYKVQENPETIIFNTTIFPKAEVSHKIISYTKSEKMESDPILIGSFYQESIELFTNKDRFYHKDLPNTFTAKDTIVKITFQYLETGNPVYWHINYKGEVTQTDSNFSSTNWFYFLKASYDNKKMYYIHNSTIKGGNIGGSTSDNTYGSILETTPQNPPTNIPYTSENVSRIKITSLNTGYEHDFEFRKKNDSLQAVIVKPSPASVHDHLFVFAKYYEDHIMGVFVGEKSWG